MTNKIKKRLRHQPYTLQWTNRSTANFAIVMFDCDTFFGFDHYRARIQTARWTGAVEFASLQCRNAVWRSRSA